MQAKLQNNLHSNPHKTGGTKTPLTQKYHRGGFHERS